MAISLYCVSNSVILTSFCESWVWRLVMMQSAAVGLERTPELLWPWRLSFALIWERVGVLEESIKGSATQYRPWLLLH